MPHALLRAQHPDLTAVLRTLCDRAAVPLVVAETDDALRAVAALGPGDLLLVDAAASSAAALARCAALVARTPTAVPVWLIHPRPATLHALRPLAKGPARWFPPDFPVLSLLDALAAHYAHATLSESAALDALSAREQEVSALVADGLTDAQIAERLAVHPSTVKTYVARSKGKLDLETRGELKEAAGRLTEG